MTEKWPLQSHVNKHVCQILRLTDVAMLTVTAFPMGHVTAWMEADLTLPVDVTDE